MSQNLITVVLDVNWSFYFQILFLCISDQVRNFTSWLGEGFEFGGSPLPFLWVSLGVLWFFVFNVYGCVSVHHVHAITAETRRGC